MFPLYRALCGSTPLREKCPYSKFFWSIFSSIRTEYGEILRISPYSIQILEDTDQKILRIRTLFRHCWLIMGSINLLIFFIPSENMRKPLFFWCFQGLYKETSDMLERMIRTYIECSVIRKSMPYPNLNTKMLMISTLGTYLKLCSGNF